MNRIIVYQSKSAKGSSFKVIDFTDGDYNLGDLVEVVEDDINKLSMVVERNITLSKDSCNACVFASSSPERTCDYVTIDGWFPCLAATQHSFENIMFKSVDSVMEGL